MALKLDTESQRVDQLIEEILSKSYCNPRHLLTQEEIEEVKEKYANIL